MGQYSYKVEYMTGVAMGQLLSVVASFGFKVPQECPINEIISGKLL
ncbi:MAG: hypothetical protein ACI9UO_001601 [Nitrospinales bacterium]|jgi:hypothetical protein